MNQPPAPTQPVDPETESVAGEEDPGASLNPGDLAPPGTPGAGDSVCPRCGGSGKLTGNQCPACGGSGKTTVGAVGAVGAVGTGGA